MRPTLTIPAIKSTLRFFHCISVEHSKLCYYQMTVSYIRQACDCATRNELLTCDKRPSDCQFIDASQKRPKKQGEPKLLWSIIQLLFSCLKTSINRTVLRSYMTNSAASSLKNIVIAISMQHSRLNDVLELQKPYDFCLFFSPDL